MLIDRFTPDWQDRLIKQKLEIADGGRLFLLIDGAFLPDFYREVQLALPGTESVSLLFEQLPACSDKTLSVSPFLVPCTSMSSSFQRVLGKCSGWPMVSAIETTEAISDLAKRLAAWCIVEAGDQRFNFRFPDTRRLPGIFDALSPSQRGALAGPALRWSYIGRDGVWNDLALPVMALAVAERPTLDDMQFSAMVGDSEVDETIVLLQDRGPLPERLHAETCSIVSEARRVAALCKFDQDLYVDWCEHCLYHAVGLAETDARTAAMEWREINSA